MLGSSFFSRWTVGGVCALVCLFAVPAVASAEPEIEPNNTVTGAVGPLVDSTVINGTRENGTDEDWFYFGSLGGGPLTVTVTIENTTSFGQCAPRDPAVCFIRASLRNTRGELMVGNGVVSNIGIIKTGDTETLEWTLPGPGTYTVQVLDGAAGDTYDLKVVGNPPLVSDPSLIDPPVGPPPPPPAEPGGPVPKTCTQLVSELGAIETRRSNTSKLLAKASKSYAKYKNATTKIGKKRKASARKLGRRYKAQIASLNKQVTAGIKALTDAKCACELLTRELKQYNAKLKKDNAALRKARKRQKTARTTQELLKLKRATSAAERRVRLDRAKIKSITTQRATRSCTT